jgi:hypothetical protein
VRSLDAFTADLLTESGAIVEPTARCLEALLPPHVATLLGTPEHVKLCFSPEEDGIPVFFDSEIFKKMAELLGERGRFSTLGIPAVPVRVEQLGDRLGEKIVLHNAVFQLERREQKRISYLLAYFKYSARSDDRQEGIVASMINEFNLSVRRVQAEILELITSNAEVSFEEAERENAERVLSALCRAQREIVREGLHDFFLSLERRLKRDIQRVHDYYQALLQEHRRVLQRERSTAEGKEATRSKIEAVERELKGKVQDLIGKYRLNLEIEPISFIRIETVVPIFWLLIKRRKETRPFPLTYNPILKSLDSLPCEACFHAKGGYLVCDDRFHIVCKQCSGSCRQCGKMYCAACHPRSCPRCASPTIRL